MTTINCTPQASPAAPPAPTTEPLPQTPETKPGVPTERPRVPIKRPREQPAPGPGIPGRCPLRRKPSTTNVESLCALQMPQRERFNPD